MIETPATPEDRYEHLRTYATVQKQVTVERLKKAITQLETEGRLVSTFTIKEVSNLDYMAYYRNPEAYALFQQHSTHLCKKREQEYAKQRATHRSSKRKHAKDGEALHKVNIRPRDPLLDYKKARLVALVHEAWQERDQIKQQAQAERAQLTQRHESEHVQLEQRYSALLQEHMQCGLTTAHLEAQIAECQAFIDRFRSSLRQEEFGPDS